MDLGIAGKRALVCAASRGLGRGCAEALAREGVEVTICARTAADVERAADEIGAVVGRRVGRVACDITTPAGRDHARRDERREQRPDDESRSAAAWMLAGRTCHGLPLEAARRGFAPARRPIDCRAGPCEPVPDRPF